jgi:hypothetical protein
MVTYSSYVLDKLALSVTDDSNPTRVESRIPVTLKEAQRIINRWMNLLMSTEPDKEILLNYSGRNFTSEGAALLAMITGLEFFSSRVVAVEFSGTLGEHREASDDTEAKMILIQSLVNTCSYYAVKLDNVADRDVEVLCSLLAKETLTHFEMTDSRLSANGGISDIESALIDYVSNTTHQPCTCLKHYGFSNVHTDDGNLTGQSYGSVLSQCTSIESIKFANCSPGKDGTELIAETLSCLIIGNMQVRESLRSIDLQGCVLNESFGLVCDPLVRVKHLEYVNLHDC